jgi:hypothetical protein
MLNSSNLVQRLARISGSNHASTFFINGPPGSGKSFLLNTLAERLPGEISRCISFGPYPIRVGNHGELGGRILQDFFEAGFLAHIPQEASHWDLVTIWRWIKENVQVAPRQTFFVFIDLAGWTPKSLKDTAQLFSVVRTLEGDWDSQDIRWLQIFAGCWDHPAMESYFREINTSFPYTVGHNYVLWEGISMQDMAEFIGDFSFHDSRLPNRKILHEITGGHPGAAIDILNSIPEGKLSFPAIISATQRAAKEGPVGQELLAMWAELSPESKRAVKALLLGKRIPVVSLPPHLEMLRIAGIANRKSVGTQSYLELRSWYVTMVLWQHLEEIDIADAHTERINVSALMPRISTVCSEAYNLINEIENLARNFVTIQLSLDSEPHFHYLMGRSLKYNRDTEVDEDAYQRAEDWRNRSLDRGLSADLNPLIAYLSTRDLANLIEELGGQADSPEWLRIAQAIRSLSDVRDAVMHNQFIDDSALRSLYDLQAEIYSAISQG